MLKAVPNTDKKPNIDDLHLLMHEAELLHPNDIPKWIHKISESGGDPYAVIGQWKTKITGSVLDETPD